MAAKSGQSSQIELLLVYGANLAALDARGKTAIDYAREAGHLELVHRLIEHQFDLTDSLTRYLCLGRTPNHLAGEHFLVVDIRPECLNSSDVSASCEGQDPKAANAAFRAELHASLQSLSASSFQELTRDIYDEIDRREVNAFVAGHYGKGKEKTLEKAHQQLLLPFLPVYQCFSSTRNQGRQKLALLNTKEFTLLIVDVLNEIRHRVYGFASASVGSLKGMMEGYTNVTGKTVTTDETFDEDNDSEPLYDSVPSEGDYDECNEIVVPRGGGVQQQQQLQNQPNQDHNSLRASSTTLITNSSKSADSQQNACYVSQNEYALLKEQMLRSATLMEQFVAENREMRGEMARLQATVERLVEENAQLKGLQLLQQQQQQQQTMMMVNQNSQSYLHQNSSSSTSLNFLEHQQQQQQLKSNSMHFDDPALQQQLQLQRNSFLRASGSRVRPQSTATTNSFQSGGGVVNNASSANSISGGTQNQQQQQQPMVNRYSNECISSSSLNHKTTPPLLSSNQSSNSSLLNYQIQAQQQQQQHQQQSFPAPPPPFPTNQSQSLSSNPNQQQQQFSAHSSSSSLSSPSQIPTLQQHQNQQQQQQQQSLPYLGSVAAAVEQLNAAHHQQQLQFNSGGGGGGGNNVSNNNVVIATSTTGVGLSQLPPTPSINTTTASSFPSKEDVIKKIEFITNSIKELLSNAREGKHDE